MICKIKSYSEALQMYRDWNKGRKIQDRIDVYNVGM